MIGIDQQLDGDQIDSLYGANNPSATNPFATLADLAGGGVSGNYGAFYDTTNQAFVASTATPITLNTTYLFNGMSIGAPTSRIVVNNYGVYNVQFSAQLFNSSGAVQTVTFWLRKNGVDIPNSAKDVTIGGDVSNYTADWSWLAEANATDYLEIIFFTPVITVTLRAVVAGGGKPAIPSMLVTIIQSSKGSEGEIVESDYKFFGAAPQSIGAGGGNPQTLTLNTIAVAPRDSVVPGRSAIVRYQFVASKSSPASSVTVELTLGGGLILPVVISAAAGSYTANNFEVIVYMNFRAGNGLEAIAVVERHVPGSPDDTNVLRGFGTWNTAIPNDIILRFIRTSGNTAWSNIEVKQATLQIV